MPRKNGTQLVASFVFMLPNDVSAGGGADIVASVTKVVHPQGGLVGSVTLEMTIHSPSRFGGFPFTVVTKSKDRAKMRAEFPLGSLQVMKLPAETVMALEAQIDTYASVEKTLDSGIEPTMISQVFLVPHVKISELSMRPFAFTGSHEIDSK